MAINVKKVGAVRRSDMLWFDPDELQIVEKKDDPLFDERSTLEPKRELINNIKKYGVLEPVICRFNPETGKTEIIDGRQRVKAARIAKKEQEEAGEIQVRVPALLRRDDDASVVGIMVSANEQRRQDAKKVRAAKAARMAAMGMSDAEIAVAFGVTKQTVASWSAGKPKAKSARPSAKAIRAELEAKPLGSGSDYDTGYRDGLKFALGE